MFLTETSLFEVTKKQYCYKLKAHVDLFFKMAAVQVIAVIMSAFGGVGGSGMSSNYLDYSVRWVSADMVISFTLMWAFAMALFLTTRTYRNIDFTFISTRLSSNLSNIALLLTAGVAGGITATLGGFLIRVIVYLSKDIQNIAGNNFIVSPQELLLGTIITTLYFILIASLGYFLGMLAQLHRIFSIMMGTFILGTIFFKMGPVFVRLVGFFADEGSLVIFLVKILFAVVVFLYSGILISSRMEVRR